MADEVSITMRPFDGNTTDPTTPAVGQAGPYSAEEWAETWKYSFGYDAVGNRGPFLSSLNEWNASAVAAQQKIEIAAGSAIVSGRHGFSEASVQLDVAPNVLGAPRLDRVVLRRDGSSLVNDGSLVVKTGTTIAYAALQQDAAPTGIWEIPLWRWQTPNGFADLTAVDFEDDRRWSNAPPVVAPKLSNNSGADVPVGTSILVNAASAFNTSTTQGDPDIFGVTKDGIIENGLSGSVAVGGIVTVRVTGAVSVNDWLMQSTVAGIFTTSLFLGGPARAITSWAGPGVGTVQAMLYPGMQPFAACKATFSGVTINGTLATIPLPTEEFDTADMHDLVTNNDRIIAPIYGIYTAKAYLHMDAGDATVLAIYLNAAIITKGQGFWNTGNANTGSGATWHAETDLLMNATDYVFIRAASNSSHSGSSGYLSLELKQAL